MLNTVKTRILAVSLFMLALQGCTSIVMKPDIDRVKKVAILSLYADQKVPNDKGYGVVTQWDNQVRLQVAEDALLTYQKEFAKLGWQVISPQKVLESKDYQQAFAIPEVKQDSSAGKFVNLMKNVYQQQFFTPAGMLPVNLDDASANTHYYGDLAKNNPRTTLGNMARKLGADAVVLIQVDYCYGSGAFSMLGNGEAVMSAGSSIKAVNQAGNMVVNMPAIQRCGGTRGKSKTGAVMINGNLQFTASAKDHFRRMFVEATRASAALSVDQIQKAMAK